MSIKIDKATVDSITKKLSKGAENDIRTGYLLGEIKEDEIIITDVHVPEQESHGTYTTVTPAEASKVLAELKKDKTVLGTANYHASFLPLESAVERESRLNMFDKSGVISTGLVVNKKGEYKIFE